MKTRRIARPPRWLAVLMALCSMVFGLMALSLSTATLAVAAGERAVIGLPFSGKWAWNANVNPPWNDVNSSHPSVHHTPGGGDWGIDIYASEGAAVRLNVGYADGAVTFTRTSSTTSCGNSVKLNVNVNGTVVGWIYFAHIANVPSATRSARVTPSARSTTGAAVMPARTYTWSSETPRTTRAT